MIIVTGGAGFIGGNFVIDSVAGCDEPVINLDKLTYAGNLRHIFLQDNHSKSSQGVLRRLHYQIQHPQGKLVRVTQGAVFDVTVDLRRSSAKFGKWVAVELSADNKRQLWVPLGVAHGFVVTSESTEFLYKITDYWYPKHEHSLLWRHPVVGIRRPFKGEPRLAGKAAMAVLLSDAEYFA